MKLNFDFDAAIFDMDGTLLDTMLYWRYATLEYLLKHRLPVRNEDLLNMRDISTVKHIREICRREGHDYGTDGELLEEVEQIMLRHYREDSQPKDHVAEFLQELKKKGVPMCIATASPCEGARIGLERAGILQYFDFIMDRTAIGSSKGEAKAFENIAARFGMTPDRCVVFEDAFYAVRGAKEAGCRVVAIEDSASALKREEIMELADVYITGYEQLL